MGYLKVARYVSGLNKKSKRTLGVETIHHPRHQFQFVLEAKVDEVGVY